MLFKKKVSARRQPIQEDPDSIFFLLRGLFFLGTIAWCVAILLQIRQIPSLAANIPRQLIPLLVWFLLCSVLFYWVMHKFAEFRTAAYYVMMTLDMVFVTLLINNTGQGNSNFYLGYNLFIAAYTLAFGTVCGALATVLSSIFYLALFMTNTDRFFAADFGVRLCFMFLVFFVVAVMIEKEKRDKQRIAEDREKIDELNRKLEKSFGDIMEENVSITEKSREKTALLSRQVELAERARSHIAFARELNARKTIEDAVLLFSRYVSSLLEVDGIALVLSDEDLKIAEVFHHLEKEVMREEISYMHPLLEAAREDPDHILFWDAADDPEGRALFEDFIPPHATSAAVYPLMESGVDDAGMYVIYNSAPLSIEADLVEEVGFLASHLGIDVQNIRYSEMLQELADTDGLTGLFNHRYFQQRLEQEISRCRRYQRPLSLIMFDIDHFKRLNDSYGHPAGDAVLRELSALVSLSLRKIDVPARYGGEEFVLILPETALSGAITLAERLRETVAKNPFNIGNGGSIEVTISIGVSSYPECADKTALITAADQALYRAKHSGRNVVMS